MRTLLTAIVASLLAVWIGVNIAQEEYLVASLSAGVSVWMVLAWARGPLTETWLIGFLLFGYIVGNRGFAQITPMASLPVFFGELGLGCALTLLALRSARGRELPLQRDGLNALILLWLAVGTGRIWVDVRQYGFLALRDFAMVYYALYFFVAQALAEHEASRRSLYAWITAGFAVLPVTGMFVEIFPTFFMTNLNINGVPMIIYKGDLLATFLYAGYVWLVPLEGTSWRSSWWRWALALTSLILGLSQLSRSSLVGLTIALVWLGFAGRWRAARAAVLTCAVGGVAVLVFSALQQKDFTQTRAYAGYEAAMSIIDYEGTRVYAGTAASDKSDNNRFRVVWWRNVIKETMAQNPIIGLGFGYDLAKGFLNDYYPDKADDFTARSPHSILVSTFGRMGFLGLGVLLTLVIYLISGSRALARRVSNGQLGEEVIRLQSMAWLIFISACFGVVLEGPMGAIPFWTILGLAHHAATHPDKADEKADAPTVASSSAAES